MGYVPRVIQSCIRWFETKSYKLLLVFMKDFDCMEKCFKFLYFSIILCYDMLSGFHWIVRGSMCHVTSRGYPWVMTMRLMTKFWNAFPLGLISTNLHHIYDSMIVPCRKMVKAKGKQVISSHMESNRESFPPPSKRYRGISINELSGL